VSHMRTPRPKDLEEMEPEELQQAINQVIGNIDQRLAINVGPWELHNLEALILVKLDRGLRLTLREQDILDHVEDIRTDYFGTRYPQRFVWPLLILILAGLVYWIFW
jgi:3-deoxy-D-arabino-heptulosonate 7-phosphate (DAHP) synthase